IMHKFNDVKYIVEHEEEHYEQEHHSNNMLPYYERC
ncbi:unnamed protein product, partial [Didymodactylos carnosus]